MQIKDGVKTTLQFTIDTSTTSITLADATLFPDPTLGQYWIWIWDATTFPNNLDDPNRERVRVTAKAGNVLTVVRGEAGQTAVGHAAGQAVRMLVCEANVKCVNHYDVTVFGAVGDGATNVATPVQAAFDAAAKTGHPIFFPAGDYAFGSEVVWLTGQGKLICDIRGASEQSVTLRHSNNSGRMLDISEENLQVHIRDIGFRNNGGPVRDWIRIGTGVSDGSLTNVWFHGANVVTGKILDFDDLYNMDFRNVTFTSCPARACIWSEGTRNGGNFRFWGCRFSFVKVGFFTANGATNHNIKFDGTKFIGSNYGDVAKHFTDLNNVAGPWTAGATSIFIGAGRDQFAPLFGVTGMVLTNDLFQEVILASAYNTSTGVLTLYEGLSRDWTGEAGAEIYTGSPAIVMGKTGSNLACDNCHFEGMNVVIADSHATKFDDCFWSFSEVSADGVGTNLTVHASDPPVNVFGVYISGQSRAHRFDVPRWTCDRADEALAFCWASAGPIGTNPGDLSFSEPIRIDAGSPNPVAHPAVLDNTSAMKIYVQSRDEIRLGIDQANSGRWGMRGVASTAQTEIRQCRIGALFHTLTTVNDASYSFAAGKASDEGGVAFTNLTAARDASLPASPQIGRSVIVMKATADAFAVNILRNGQNIMGAAADDSILSGSSHEMAVITFVGGDTGWHVSKE